MIAIDHLQLEGTSGKKDPLLLSEAPPNFYVTWEDFKSQQQQPALAA